MGFIGKLNIINEDMSDFIDFIIAISALIFTENGSDAICQMRCQASSSSIMGMIHLDQEVAKLTVNIRYPVTLDEETVYSSMMPNLDKYDIGVVKLNHQPPIYVLG